MRALSTIALQPSGVRMSREQRKLAAILAADVVGYSRLMGRDESGTLARLRKNRAERLDPVVAKYGGGLVKLTGDGALIEFASAVDALSAAIEFQQAMAETNSDQPADSALVFRMGLHLGDLIVDGDDLYGDGVNVAARLEAEAPAGGILMSRTVHEAVIGRVKATFDDLGTLALKNIERPVQAFSVKWEPSDWRLPVTAEVPVTAQHSQEPLRLPDRPSIAVLPFQNMSGDPDQEYFADGMAEEIIAALSRFRSFVVIARNSSFTYKGRAVDIRRVVLELGVRYVLEGSVRKGGDRIRIIGQLIDAESGAHLWADKFDGSLASVFDLQDQITTKVVSAIAPKLQQNDIERARRKPTEKMDSYDCFLRGMSASLDRSKWSTSEAQGWFRRAADLDPEHAAALAWLSHSIQIRGILRGVPLTPAEQTEAIELSERACKLAQDDGSVLGRAAQVFCYTGRQYDRANSLMEDAVKLNPNDAGTWNHRGWIALMCDEPERSIQSFEHALVLSPMNPRRGTIWNGMAFAYFILGQYDKGREFAERSVELVADVHSLPALIANEVRSGQLANARQRAGPLMNL